MLPTGTVSLLFTDIEGSTRLLQQLGDGYAAVRDRHAAIVRRAIGEGGGGRPARPRRPRLAGGLPVSLRERVGGRAPLDFLAGFLGDPEPRPAPASPRTPPGGPSSRAGP